MSSITSVGPRTLADVVPGGLARNVVLVAGGAVLVALSAQLKFPLPFTPVPVTLQTFAVLLVGAALGWKRAALSMGLYLLAGMAGLPWFADRQSGWAFASFGYIVGFVVAAALVGYLSERRADRSPITTVGQMVLGNLVIYGFGVPGLMLFTGMSLGKALLLGVVPFLIFDAIKIVISAGLLPGTWRLVNARRD